MELHTSSYATWILDLSSRSQPTPRKKQISVEQSVGVSNEGMGTTDTIMTDNGIGMVKPQPDIKSSVIS